MKIGDVYIVDLPILGTVQSGRRPCVVFQNNMGNTYSSNVVVLPMTTNSKKADFPTHVFVRSSDSGMKRDSVVLCENPITVPKNRVVAYVSSLSDAYMSKIAMANLLASGAIAYLDFDSIRQAYDESVKLINYDAKQMSRGGNYV